MNRLNRKVLIFFRSILKVSFSVFILFSCNYCRYGEAIIKESKTTFEKNKKYIYLLAFEGQVVEMKFCPDCHINKYTLKLQLNKLSIKPDISNLQYPPYYMFDNDSVLIITVSRNLFEQVKEKDIVSKERESCKIRAEQLELEYLNKKNDKWLP